MPQRKRSPAVPKKIEKIDPEEDVRVRILGTVLEKREDSAVIDDGSKTVEAFLDEEDLEKMSENQKVRIFGRVLPTPDSFEIQGEIIQDMDDLNFELYNKVKEIVGEENV